MDTLPLLRARAGELELRGDEVEEWAQRLDDGFVQALLSNLLRYEEALVELAR